MSPDKTKQALVDWLRALHNDINTLAALSVKWQRHEFGGRLKASITEQIIALTAAPPAQQQSEVTLTDKSECTWSLVSSRVCQRGTMGCTVDHPLLAATPPSLQEPQEAGDNG